MSDIRPTTEQDEYEKYTEIWKNPGYRINSPAMRDHFEGISEWVEKHKLHQLIDFGAGKGTLDLALRAKGYAVHMLDLAENCLDDDVREALDEELTFEQACLWDDTERHADGVICIDVLEHIPMTHVQTVIEHIHATATHGYCNAALFPHIVGGVDLHLTIMQPKWWFQFFPDAECVDAGSHAVMVW